MPTNKVTMGTCAHTGADVLYTDRYSTPQWCDYCGAARESFGDPWQLPKIRATYDGLIAVAEQLADQLLDHAGIVHPADRGIVGRVLTALAKADEANAH